MKSKNVQSHYNNDVLERAGSAYEFDRWHKDAISEAGYWMTRKGLLKVLKKVNAKECFELGPGAGTWTKLLCERFPNVHINAFDISSHMLEMAAENVKDCDIDFIEGDFDAYDGKEEWCDLFFSSRVFEYLPDQQKAVDTIGRILTPGGQGVISTKYPRGAAPSDLHEGRVHPNAFRALLKNAGLEVVSISPLTLTVPFFKSATLNRVAYVFLGWMPLSIIHALFCESYVVHFKKS
tara:strand:- start:26013 stop:26720 length:708 start_codon:yes stop_codon:yes gene_type:complete